MGCATRPTRNGEGIVDNVIHMTAYQLKDAVKHTKQGGIRVFNQFGELLVDTVKADRILVPATKDINGQVVPPPVNAAHNVDHYRCYKIKVNKSGPAFPKGLTATVDDQFEDLRTFAIKKPKLFCTPVDKDGSVIKNAEGHMMCYQAKPSSGQPKHTAQPGVFMADECLAAAGMVNNGHRIATKKEDLLCVPSISPPAGDFCGDSIHNQAPFEECDGDAAPCAPTEVCKDDCTCSLCGNAIVDGGEDCEVDADCGGFDQCNDTCQCEPKPPLGERTISMVNGGGGGFFSSLLPGPSQGTPVGTFVLDAGPTNVAGEAAVSLGAGGPYFYGITLRGDHLADLHAFGLVHRDDLLRRRCQRRHRFDNRQPGGCGAVVHTGRLQ